MDEIKLKYSYMDYRFAVTENNYLYPWNGPGIVIERIADEMIIACSNYDQFVGTTPSDKSYMKRLHAAARFLTHIMQYADDLGTYRLSDIRPIDIYFYEQCICPQDEVIYIGEFLYNLACAGHLDNINPEDVLVRK